MEKEDKSGSAQYNRRTRIIFLVVLGAIAGWFCYLIARPFLLPVIGALVFSVIFAPLHRRIQIHVRRSNLAALISTILVLLIIVIPAFLLGAAIRRELVDVYHELSQQTDRNGGWIQYLSNAADSISLWLGRYVDISEIDLRKELMSRVQQASSYLLRQAADTAGGLLSFIVNGVVTFFTLFFLFRDGRSLYRRIAVITPLRADQIERLTRRVGKTITASMYGGLAVAVVQGGLTALAFWTLGLPSPILWGAATSIFSFIPIIGSAAIWLPAAVFLIIGGHFIKGILLIAWGAGVVGMSDNIVRPYVISEQVDFHPLYVFFALLGGVQAFGIMGIFIGPVMVAIAEGILSLIREELRQPKGSAGQ